MLVTDIGNMANTISSGAIEACIGLRECLRGVLDAVVASPVRQHVILACKGTPELDQLAAKAITEGEAVRD